LDVEKTVGILNAIAAGLFRLVEIIVPVLLVFCIGIVKLMASTFLSANVYRKKKSKENLLTHLDEI
jgi:hypothetical protein